MGKTTLALQLAAAATRDVPVVVVTFEHTSQNLTLKLPCARAGAASRWRRAVAGGRGSRPSGFPEPPSRVSGTALRRQGRAAGSFGGAGRGPTPPSSTAAPSHTLPRRCLRGVQATPGSGALCRHGTLVSAAARGPVSAAPDTASPLDCPRWLLGCQAMFRPPSAVLASILVVRCSVTAPPYGGAVLPVCGHLQQALRVQPGHARAWQSWRRLAHTLGVRHPGECSSLGQPYSDMYF